MPIGASNVSKQNLGQIMVYRPTDQQTNIHIETPWRSLKREKREKLREKKKEKKKENWKGSVGQEDPKYGIQIPNLNTESQIPIPNGPQKGNPDRHTVK